MQLIRHTQTFKYIKEDASTALTLNTTTDTRRAIYPNDLHIWPGRNSLIYITSSVTPIRKGISWMLALQSAGACWALEGIKKQLVFWIKGSLNIWRAGMPIALKPILLYPINQGKLLCSGAMFMRTLPRWISIPIWWSASLKKLFHHSDTGSETEFKNCRKYSPSPKKPYIFPHPPANH